MGGIPQDRPNNHLCSTFFGEQLHKKWEQVVHVYWHKSVWNQCQGESLCDSLQNKSD